MNKFSLVFVLKKKDYYKNKYFTFRENKFRNRKQNVSKEKQLTITWNSVSLF